MTTRLRSRRSALAQRRSIGTKSVGVDALRDALDGAAEFAGQLARRPPVGDQRVRLLQIPRYRAVRLARQIDDDRNVADAKARRLVQRVRVHDVGLSLARAMRRHAARQNHSSSACSAVIVRRPNPRRC